VPEHLRSCRSGARCSKYVDRRAARCVRLCARLRLRSNRRRSCAAAGNRAHEPVTATRSNSCAEPDARRPGCQIPQPLVATTVRPASTPLVSPITTTPPTRMRGLASFISTHETPLRAVKVLGGTIVDRPFSVAFLFVSFSVGVPRPPLNAGSSANAPRTSAAARASVQPTPSTSCGFSAGAVSTAGPEPRSHRLGARASARTCRRPCLRSHRPCRFRLLPPTDKRWTKALPPSFRLRSRSCNSVQHFARQGFLAECLRQRTAIRSEAKKSFICAICVKFAHFETTQSMKLQHNESQRFH